MVQLSWDPTKDNLLVTASNDKSVRLWDTRASKCVAMVETKGENINVTYSRDGSMVVVGDKKDHVSWIDVRSHKVVFERTFPSETNEVCFDNTGELFFATTGAGTVDIYRGELTRAGFVRVASLPAHTASCYSISFSADGNFFAVGSADSLVSVWDRHELICSHTVARFKSPARTTCFSSDSSLLASGGEDGFIDIANVKDGSQSASFRVNATINSISWNPANLLLAYVAERSELNRAHDPGSIYLLAP